jgi:hypothetical protein
MINFNNRLKSLKDRRQGVDVRAAFESKSIDNIHFDLREKEQYELLKESVSIKYIIGAMAPVEQKSTEISIREGERVANSLIKSLRNYGINTTSRLQGSVALDIHIKHHSDVDMLIIETNTIQTEKPNLNPALYSPATDKRSMVEIIKDLRKKSEEILPKNFPETNIKLSGNKSIALDGGSLKRKIDIVPASWFDTHSYQKSRNESDRGIKIYHKGNHELILNLPFTHIKLISDRDVRYFGNLKNSIRLMKNMIADMPEYKKNKVKKLSSYDLASIAYHMDNMLNIAYEFRLGLVEKIREHLHKILNDFNYRNSLYVPDKSRKIFDNDEKIDALKILEKEFTDLAEAVFKDLYPYMPTYNANLVLTKKVA